MFLTGLGTAVPAHCYTQQDCWQALQASTQLQELQPRSRALLRKVLSTGNGMHTRHLSFDDLGDAFETAPDTLHARFLSNAPRLADESARVALADADCAADSIDAVLVSTCTGYLCPGLTSYLVESLGLNPKVTALDLVGQGCAAAVPNLSAASALIGSGRARHVLSVCVEVCSAAMYLDDDPGVLVSACLFADGAAAAVLCDTPRPDRRQVEWRGSTSITAPAHRETLRFEQKGGRLRNILRPEVPEQAAAHVDQVFEQQLKESGLMRQDISTWLVHPGGRLVLDAVGRRLGLQNGSLRWSAEILRDYGNLSSPSVLFALKRALNSDAPDGWWWMSTFGAGFSCHGALLRVGTAS